MSIGDLDDLIYSTVVRERPFEGGDSSRDADSSATFATYLYPELGCWLPLLARLSFPVSQAAYFAELARKNGTDFQSELFASGLVAEDRFWRAMAAELGVGYAASLDPARLIVRDENAIEFLRRRSWHIPVKIEEKNGSTSYLISPDRLDPDHLRKLLDRYPEISRRAKIVAPKTLRSALFARVRVALVKTAVSDLFDRYPDLSARIVANAWQGSVCGAGLVLLFAALLYVPANTYAALHLLSSVFFLSCVGLRFAAIRSTPPRAQAPALPASTRNLPAPALPASARNLPVYSVLVALYREEEIVPDLIAALDRLVWPKTRLEIKLVCEEDDFATLHALGQCNLPGHMEVVKVPVFGPRTKPKALAYALPVASGELVALYDAEDNPHPMQLVEAWRRFQASGPDLACVQAPLEISNRDAGPFCLMFAFEYAALFRGLLPWLTNRRLLAPLGGTSNHFRRLALDRVGGWDPYNVTEDADLGVRLARFAYRTEMILLPTFEAAPERWSEWLPQRTRWFKGWLQCWLVHMRDPLSLAQELGFGSFLIAQILFAGMVVSALAHPFLVVTAFVLAFQLSAEGPMSTWQSSMLVFDVVNVVCGYLSFLLLGWQTLAKTEKKSFWKIVLYTPVYWMMISMAAWRAVWHLWRRPHHWEKTPHRRPLPT